MANLQQMLCIGRDAFPHDKMGFHSASFLVEGLVAGATNLASAATKRRINSDSLYKTSR